MYRHILLFVDAADGERKAFEHGLQLAASLQAKVTLVVVRPPLRVLAVAPEVVVASPADHDAAARADAEQRIDEAAEAAQAKGVAFETINVEHESSSAAILDVANEKACDLIVLPAPTHRGVTALVLGDVGKEVAEAATIPVLLVR